MPTTTTITVHRIDHPLGWVEFPADQLAAAEAYRDAHHPGAPINTIEKAVPDEPPAE